MAFVSAFFSVLLWKISQNEFEVGNNRSGWIALVISAANGAHAAHLFFG